MGLRGLPGAERHRRALGQMGELMAAQLDLAEGAPLQRRLIQRRAWPPPLPKKGGQQEGGGQIVLRRHAVLGTGGFQPHLPPPEGLDMLHK